MREQGLIPNDLFQQSQPFGIACLRDHGSQTCPGSQHGALKSDRAGVGGVQRKHPGKKGEAFWMVTESDCLPGQIEAGIDIVRLDSNCFKPCRKRLLVPTERREGDAQIVVRVCRLGWTELDRAPIGNQRLGEPAPLTLHIAKIAMRIRITRVERDGELEIRLGLLPSPQGAARAGQHQIGGRVCGSSCDCPAKAFQSGRQVACALLQTSYGHVCFEQAGSKL